MLEFCSKWCCWGCMEGGIIHEARGEEWWNSGVGEERANIETRPYENMFLRIKFFKSNVRRIKWRELIIVNKCIPWKANTKNSGWKSTFLLQWPLVRGRVSLRRCICKYPWLFMIVSYCLDTILYIYVYKPSIKLLYLTTPTCLAWWSVRNMLNPRRHLALLFLKLKFPTAKQDVPKKILIWPDIENAKTSCNPSASISSWHLLKKFGFFL